LYGRTYVENNAIEPSRSSKS